LNIFPPSIAIAIGVLSVTITNDPVKVRSQCRMSPKMWANHLYGVAQDTFLPSYFNF